MIDHFFQVLFVMGSLPFGAGAEPYDSEVGQPIAGSGQLSFSRQLTISSLLCKRKIKECIEKARKL